MNFRVSMLLLIMFLIGSAATGCATGARSERAAAALTNEELTQMKNLRDRMSQDGQSLSAALTQLQSLTRDYMTDENSLALNVAKAKLLDSLQSTFKHPGDAALVATQKAIALYLMYDLEQAQESAFDAKVEAARVSILALGDSQSKMQSLLDQSIQNETAILSELNAPRSAQVARAADEFFNQVTAFQKELATSDNPKLKALAAKVATADDKASKAKDKVEQVLLSANAAKDKQP